MRNKSRTTGTGTKRRMLVIGVPVDIVTMDVAVRRVLAWAEGTVPRMVFVRDVASLMAAVDSSRLRDLHDQAALVVPDGMPLVWYGRLSGHGDSISRVSGADLVDAVCAASIATGQSHFFYGGKPGVAETLVQRLLDRHPGLVVAGSCAPPMRMMGEDFQLDERGLAEMDIIRAANPDFIWVGLSSPKQEFWMREAVSELDKGVFFGVGAAFDFHAGTIKRAPAWMRNNGLEWLHRLISEPKRLWRRYLVLAPKFVLMLCWQALTDRGAK